MKTIYQLINWDCYDDDDDIEILYSNEDLQCVIHHLLTKERTYLSCISKDAYLNAQFNLNQPYSNNIDTWNKILSSDLKIFEVKVSSDVFNENKKMTMPELLND